MSHCICGFNKEGKEMAYVDFHYSNYVAASLYEILDANDYHAGVSGSGDSVFYSVQQMEKALETYKEIFSSDAFTGSSDKADIWYQKQVLNLLLTCLETAKKEGNVRVCFA